MSQECKQSAVRIEWNGLNHEVSQLFGEVLISRPRGPAILQSMWQLVISLMAWLGQLWPPQSDLQWPATMASPTRNTATVGPLGVSSASWHGWCTGMAAKSHLSSTILDFTRSKMAPPGATGWRSDWGHLMGPLWVSCISSVGFTWGTSGLWPCTKMTRGSGAFKVPRPLGNVVSQPLSVTFLHWKPVILSRRTQQKPPRRHSESNLK